MDIHNTLVELIAKQNPTIIEIGSNDGSDSIKFLNNFKDIKLICFEIDSRVIKKFKTLIHDERCLLVETAVGNYDGVSDFYTCSGVNPYLPEHGEWDQSSSIKKPMIHLQVFDWCHFNTIIKVPIVRLDSWIKTQNINTVDFIWADVQGAEKELIEGAMETLTGKTRYFFTEYSEQELYEGALNMQQIQNLLPTFELVQVFENNVLLKNTQF